LPPPGGRPGRPRVPPKALPDFVEIAEAGGGVYVQILLEASRRRPASSKERERKRGQGNAQANEGTRRVVEHILVLSFGDRFKREMREFTRIYYEYKDAGLFK